MSLSCVRSVDHAARRTGDRLVPTAGTGMDMTLRGGVRQMPGRQMSCGWGTLRSLGQRRHLTPA